MGWKTLKEAMGITHHVEVAGDEINIGSSSVPALVSIDTRTGAVTEASGFSGVLRSQFPSLADAAPADLLSLIHADDTFQASIKVYSYKGGTITESYCEIPGYPHTTHAGERMYENTHSTDKALVVTWAKRNARLHMNGTIEAIERLDQQKQVLQRELANARCWLAELEAEYPIEA